MKITQLSVADIENYFETLFLLKCRSLRKSFQEEDCAGLEETCRKKLHELSGYIEVQKAVVFGAFDGDLLIGFLWAYPRTFFDQPRMFINGIAVFPEYEGTGVAKQLVKALVCYAQECQYEGLDLTVAPFNEKAVGFYQHLGFETERIQMKLSI